MNKNSLRFSALIFLSLKSSSDAIVGEYINSCIAPCNSKRANSEVVAERGKLKLMRWNFHCA